MSKNKQVDKGPVKKRQKNVPITSFVSKDLVETALVKQQLISDVNFRFTEHMSDFSEFVSSYTKALANAPYKYSFFHYFKCFILIVLFTFLDHL